MNGGARWQSPTEHATSDRKRKALTVGLADLTNQDIAVAGGKGANLGELVRAGLPVPDGFVVTTEAYDWAAAEAGVDPRDAAGARRRLRSVAIPPAIALAIRATYRAPGGARVAVRSSATAEDLPEASFAGQQDTLLNVEGEDAVLDAVRHCWASLWNERAVAPSSRQSAPIWRPPAASKGATTSGSSACPTCAARLAVRTCVRSSPGAAPSTGARWHGATCRACCFRMAPTSRRRLRPPRRRGALRGTGVSPGVASGIARVIHSPAGARLEPGEVLVAPSTDPGWTPLFLTASALVMEMGGMTSHGAVVAREYGIPAVVGVPGATARLTSGQRVVVDGSAGTVVSEAVDPSIGGNHA
jgi:phosphoenolpyruvate synthase/pyruvate phosphate dikinase